MASKYLERWSVGAELRSARKMHNSRNNYPHARDKPSLFLQLIYYRFHRIIFNIISYIK